MLSKAPGLLFLIALATSTRVTIAAKVGYTAKHHCDKN